MSLFDDDLLREQEETWRHAQKRHADSLARRANQALEDLGVTDFHDAIPGVFRATDGGAFVVARIRPEEMDQFVVRLENVASGRS